ncbi:MAG: DNA gyrase inhibitor YacG [Pseudomonadota bacterium]
MKTNSTKCPICDQAGDGKYAPFCSKRCADVDLHRWLSGNYAIPAVEDDSDGTRSDADEA